MVSQRLFSFTQIFFFALTFMSSWETMALYVVEIHHL
jgi:choline transport protein